MTVTALAAFRLVEFLNYDEIGIFVPCYHHLGNTLTGVHHEVAVAEVYQQYHQLATVIGIHRAGGVERSVTGSSMSARKSIPALCGVA